MLENTVKAMVNAANHCPTRTRQRFLLGIACALEVGEEKRAKALYEAALELGLFQAGKVPKGTRIALAGVWLVKALALHPVPVKAVLQMAWNSAFNASTIYRAARLLRVVRSKCVGKGVAVWSLPASKAFWQHLFVQFTRMEEHARAAHKARQDAQGTRSLKGRAHPCALVRTLENRG